jgi:hypothetical protein
MAEKLHILDGVAILPQRGHRNCVTDTLLISNIATRKSGVSVKPVYKTFFLSFSSAKYLAGTAIIRRAVLDKINGYYW